MSEHKQRRAYIEKLLTDATPLLMEPWSATPGADSKRNSMLKTSNKSGFSDLVTIYDKRVEEFLKAQIAKDFPGEHFIGEEGSADKDSTYEKMKSLDSFWIADPIDGTTNFSRAYPFFSSTIAWVSKTSGQHHVCSGGTLNPVSNELFSAHRGGGATLNGSPLKVTQIENPKEALLASGFVSLRAGEADHCFQTFVKVTKQTLGVRRDGSAALDLAFVAAGRIDSYWEWGLSPWDMATGSLLVEEAGGLVSSEKNETWTIFDPDIVSSNKLLHPWIKEQIK
ncbi:inositol monophosphatase [bacterium]|nr:inositol monophosphatase [bacterium]